LLVMANTMAMTVRERTKEVGTLKALGFQRGTIARLFVTEALLVAIIGGFIGTVGTMLIYKSFDVSIYIPNVQAFAPTMLTLGTALVVAIVVGLISVTYSAYRVSGMTIAAALRSTE
jgi:putative ABC transport system permease protein